MLGFRRFLLAKARAAHRAADLGKKNALPKAVPSGSLPRALNAT
jgi:hypothetical protein